jgi:hypothetical protein
MSSLERDEGFCREIQPESEEKGNPCHQLLARIPSKVSREGQAFRPQPMGLGFERPFVCHDAFESAHLKSDIEPCYVPPRIHS